MSESICHSTCVSNNIVAKLILARFRAPCGILGLFSQKLTHTEILELSMRRHALRYSFNTLANYFQNKKIGHREQPLRHVPQPRTSAGVQSPGGKLFRNDDTIYAMLFLYVLTHQPLLPHYHSQISSGLHLRHISCDESSRQFTDSVKSCLRGNFAIKIEKIKSS